MFFLTLLPTLLMAGTKGRIKGTVVDLQTGEALIGANVIVMGSSIGAATDANGEFLLMNLEAGTFDVRASYLGYQTITLTGVRVNADLTTYISFELPSEEVQVGTVTIVAERPLIKKDATNAVRLTTSEDIDALPVRGVNNIIGANAGVVIQDNGVYIRGGRIDEVGFYLEGVNVTNPQFGGRGINIAQDALEEIQVQAGGYTAEFGGANAGIVRQQLKSGGQQIRASFEYITDNITFKSKDDYFDGEKRLGAYWYGYTEASAVLSGPLFSNKVKFFTNVNYVHRRDRFPHSFPGIDIGEISDAITQDTVNLVYPAGMTYHNQGQWLTFTGTLNFDLKPLLVRVSGMYTHSTFDDQDTRNIRNFMNPRTPQHIRDDGSLSLKLTHILSPTMFYELTAGYFFDHQTRQDPFLQDNWQIYGDSVANADAGWVWARSELDLSQDSRNGRYVHAYSPSVMGFTFRAPGYIDLGYRLRDRTNITVSGALNWMIGKTHSLKIGGEYQQFTMRQWAFARDQQVGFAQSFQNALVDPAYAGMTETEIQTAVAVNQGVDNYGYDELGNVYDGEGYNAPHKPVFASAYIQDRIEYEDIILNLGLRYDYIDVDNLQLVDPSRPELGVNENTGAIIAEGWEEVPTFSSVSPRIGISFPVTDQTVFHAQFGKFIQQTRLNDIYQGYQRTGYEFRQSYAFLGAIGKNIRPTRTTQYELGFTQQLTDFMSIDVTGYYKDIKGQVIFFEQPTASGSPFGAYYTLINGDYATTKGLEFNLNMRRYERIAMNASLAFQDASGTGSNPYSNTGIVGAAVENTIFYPKFIAPLDFSQALRANINIDYRFGPNDGPALLNDFGVSALLQYNSGHPYTAGDGVPNLENDTRGRYPVEPLNASTTPSVFQVDLRIDKSFNIWDRLKANVYLRIVNLFDRQNVDNVFLRTGAADDNGVLTDPQLVGTKIEEYGEQYVEVYQAINGDYYEDYLAATLNYLYGAPRQIILGIRLEY